MSTSQTIDPLYAFLDSWAGEKFTEQTANRWSAIPDTQLRAFVDDYCAVRSRDSQYQLIEGNSPAAPAGELRVVIPDHWLLKNQHSGIRTVLLYAHAVAARSPLLQLAAYAAHYGEGSRSAFLGELGRLGRLRELHDTGALHRIETDLVVPWNDELNGLNDYHPFPFSVLDNIRFGGESPELEAVQRAKGKKQLGRAMRDWQRIESATHDLTQMLHGFARGSGSVLFDRPEVRTAFERWLGVARWIMGDEIDIQELGREGGRLGRDMRALSQIYSLEDIEQETKEAARLHDLVRMDLPVLNLPDLTTIIELRKENVAFEAWRTALSRGLGDVLDLNRSAPKWSEAASFTLQEHLDPERRRLETSLNQGSMRSAIQQVKRSFAISVLSTAGSFGAGGKILPSLVSGGISGAANATVDLHRNRRKRKATRAELAHYLSFF